MKYRIKYTFDTGDSLNCFPDNVEYLEIEWDDLGKAVSNLNRIREHYDMYQSLNSYKGGKSREEILELCKEKDWFCSNSEMYMSENTIRLFTDEGKEFIFWPEWIGYFEKLKEVEIVGPDLYKVTFD